MILGIGVDLVENRRIRILFLKYYEKFLYKILSLNEIMEVNSLKINFISKKFCVKESFLKALGIGLRNGLTFKNIELLKTFFKKPLIKKKKYKIFLSISHEKNVSIGIIIIINFKF